jgi:hypothetical protein
VAARKSQTPVSKCQKKPKIKYLIWRDSHRPGCALLTANGPFEFLGIWRLGFFSAVIHHLAGP